MIESDDGSRLAEVRVYSYDLTYAHGTYVMSQGREISTLPQRGGGRDRQERPHWLCRGLPARHHIPPRLRRRGHRRPRGARAGACSAST